MPSAEGFVLERGSVLSVPGEEKKSARKIPKRKATCDEQKFDPLGDAFSFGRRPVQFLSNKFDILESVLNGGWQEENKTLENLPGWDPVSAVHKAAGITWLNIYPLIYKNVISIWVYVS